MSFIEIIQLHRTTAKSTPVTGNKCFDAAYRGDIVFVQTIAYRQLDPMSIENPSLAAPRIERFRIISLNSSENTNRGQCNGQKCSFRFRTPTLAYTVSPASQLPTERIGRQEGQMAALSVSLNCSSKCFPKYFNTFLYADFFSPF